MEELLKTEKYQTWSSLDRIEGVDIWTSNEIQKNVTITLRDGVVEEIFPNPGRTSGLTLLPSGVDAQVHLRVPGQSQKETARTGLLSMLFGGVGAGVTMPNTLPVLDDSKVLQAAKEEVETFSVPLGIQVLFTGSITKGQLGKSLSPFEDLAKAGAVAFTDDGLGVESDEVMRQAFEKLEVLGLPLLQHAEMPGHRGILSPSQVQRDLGVEPYSDEPEYAMLKRDVELLRSYPKARYHLLHMSSARCLGLLKRARAEGLKVTAEVSPHHLFFSADDIQRENPSFKMNPPLRTPQDCLELLRALAEGEIDWVATDHAPHEREAKMKGFASAPFGTVGLETFLPVLMYFFQQGKLNEKRLVEVFSSRPAAFFGLRSSDGWGTIQKGVPLRAVLFDLSEEPSKLDGHSLHSLSKNTCFEGVKLPLGFRKHYTPKGCFDIRIES